MSVMHLLLLLLLIGCTHGTALNSSFSNSTANEGAALNATTSSLKMRASTTSLAGLTAFWTAVTYVYVIYHGSSLAQGLALPRRSFERSLAALLGSAWVPHLVAPLDPSDETRFKIVWFRKGGDTARASSSSSTETDQKVHFALGYGEPLIRDLLEGERPQEQGTTTSTGQVWFHTASPAMRNLIMAAMWQYWSLWMTVAMVVLTALYNGFLFDKRGPDAVVRLVLVCLYAGTNVAYSVVFHRYFWQVLDAVANQACWVDISKTFAFFRPDNHRDALRRHDDAGRTMAYDHVYFWDGERPLYLRQFKCELLGGIATSELYRSCNRQTWSGVEPCFGVDKPGPVDLADKNHNPSRFQKNADKLDKRAEDQLKLMIDSEVKALEKASESALEKLLANMIVLVGICLSTGLAPWTTMRSQESVAAQIGSYAIILSVSTGVTALIASLTSMSNVAHSATVLRRFQHYLLGLAKDRYEAGITERHARFGIPGAPDPHLPGVVTLRDLWAGTASKRRRLLWLVWGPAMGLMPHTAGDKALRKLPHPRAGEENIILLRDYRVDQAASH
ncbi:hypothetical protein MY1884_008301 [Beauveria asiatica]